MKSVLISIRPKFCELIEKVLAEKDKRNEYISCLRRIANINY